MKVILELEGLEERGRKGRGAYGKIIVFGLKKRKNNCGLFNSAIIMIFFFAFRE